MRPYLIRYFLLLGLPVEIDLLAQGIFAVLTGYPEMLFWVVPWDLIVLVGTNFAVAWFLFFRPIQGVFAGTVTAESRRALNHLPRWSAAWVLVFYCILHPLGIIISPYFGSVGTEAPPTIYLIFMATVMSATAAYLVYFMTTALVTRIKQHVFDRYDIIIPASGAHIRSRLVVAILLLSTTPLIVVVFEVFVFASYRPVELYLSLESALMVDMAVTAFVILMGVMLLPRTFTAPLKILLGAVERVAGGDLSTRAPVTSDDEIGIMTNRFNELVEDLRERDQIRKTFGKYVPDSVAERLIRDPEILKGEDRFATIMFTDIADFTTISEQLTPAETIQLLNDYMEFVVEPIHEFGGVVNNFIGDAVFASFNVPNPDEHHARNAVRAALEIEKRLKGRFFGPDQNIALETRIGINTGQVAAGVVGSGDRLGYAILGDAVNIAARLEGAVKSVDGSILVSQATRDLAGDEFAFHPVGPIRIRGRIGEVEGYALSV